MRVAIGALGLVVLLVVFFFSLGAAWLRSLHPSLDSLARLPEASLAPAGAVFVRQERSLSGGPYPYLLMHYETAIPPKLVLLYYETWLIQRGWSVSVQIPPAPEDEISACRGDSGFALFIDPATTTDLTKFYVQLSPVLIFGCGVRGPPSPEPIAFVVVASFTAFMLVAQIARLRGRARRGPTEMSDQGIAQWSAMFFWVPYLVVALRLGPELDVPEWLRWLGLFLTVAGIVFAIRAVLVLGRHYDLELEIHADHELVRRGPYRLVRHPVYTGLAVHLLGACIATGNGILIVGTLVVILPVFYLRVRSEERLLRERFGAAYDEYARQVGMLVPLL
ncbi:MAG TPA: isoprenylcysteine carboxylmethyltransferase family protein [Candidatus Bathyarchaeia archaeon]|nr:isoprenylcysteine carboxylmethyltransferase family protein [Candidatus Bathyarchaeia archaeon]